MIDSTGTEITYGTAVITSYMHTLLLNNDYNFIDLTEATRKRGRLINQFSPRVYPSLFLIINNLFSDYYFLIKQVLAVY